MAVDNWLPKPIDGKETGKMEAPLKAVDIRDTLNSFGGNVSNKTTSFFKPEANINRWSKHKPIVTGYNADKSRFVSFDDEAWEKQAGTAPTVYIGFTPNTNRTALAEVWEGCTEDDWFQYVLPTGGELQPFRMGDFRGYRADATSPFKSFSSNSTEFEPINGTATFYLNMRYYLNDELDAVEGGMLSLKDMAVFKDTEVYTMVIITKKGNDYKAYDGGSVETASWGQMEGEINIGKINSTNEGTYECAVALRDSTGTYYKLPFNHITLTAKIFYENDYFEISNGSAAYSGTTDGAVSLYITVHAGAVTSEGTWVKSLYIAGEHDTAMQGPFGSGELTLNKGETGTLRITVEAGDTNWDSILMVLQNNTAVWLNYNNSLDGAILVNVG